jgi:hypothetical protein
MVNTKTVASGMRIKPVTPFLGEEEVCAERIASGRRLSDHAMLTRLPAVSSTSTASGKFL